MSHATGSRESRASHLSLAAKVIAITEAPSKRRPLTELQRQNIVIKYREKGRKIARSILRSWQSRLEMEDIDSVVDLSLVEAADRFDPLRGASFITFLYYHLRGNLIRLVSDAANASIVPLLELQDDQDSEFGRASSFDINSVLCTNEIKSPEELASTKQLARRSIEACKKLDDVEREIIYRLFVQEDQVMEVAADLGYSRCHVSRVKRHALSTLERAMEHDTRAMDHVIESSRVRERRTNRVSKKVRLERAKAAA